MELLFHALLALIAMGTPVLTFASVLLGATALLYFGRNMFVYGQLMPDEPDPVRAYLYRR